MNSRYVISTIPQNLSKEDTIVQIVDVLDHLTNITQDIFSRVNDRIETNTRRLSVLTQRVDAASSKVDQLKGAKNATRVFSSSKYPAANVNADYVSIFKGESEVKLKRHEVKHTNYTSSYEPLSKLQFYHVKIPGQKNKDALDGLGNVPLNIKFVNDLLLFNSGKNLYKEFILTDSLKGPAKINDKEFHSISELGAAPLSISQRSSLVQTNKDNYFYTPKIEELPALDVPLDLPDLPGIADDLRYEIELDPGIAPSAVNQGGISEVPLELPNVMELKIGAEEIPVPPPPMEALPEPPPVQNPPLSVVDDSQAVKSFESVALQDSTVNSGPELTAADVPLPPVQPPHQDSSRASLMEAIRNAGGSLKANLKRTQRDDAPGKKNTTSSGDLMADLHSKLLMRRKGISGAKNLDQAKNVVTPDSTLARMSSLIPPPTGRREAESVSTDDEDWE